MSAKRVMGAYSRHRSKRRKPPKTKVGKRRKARKVMGEFAAGTLHSGSKRGPIVHSRAQAQAIAMSESGQAKKKD